MQSWALTWEADCVAAGWFLMTLMNIYCWTVTNTFYAMPLPVQWLMFLWFVPMYACLIASMLLFLAAVVVFTLPIFLLGLFLGMIGVIKV